MVVERTRWRTKSGTAQRGGGRRRLGPASGPVFEVRAHHAAPAAQGVPIGEPLDLDYKGQGHHPEPPG